MEIRIKIIRARDFLEITTHGILTITTSRQLIADIVDVQHQQTDYGLLVDFRDTKNSLSIGDVYQLASELFQYGNTFRRKVALLVMPGHNFERASFFETCSFNRGFTINAYTDYEKALRWILEANQ